MKKLLFIYNVRAGKGKAKAALPAAIDIFTQAGYLVTAYPTQGKADATWIAANLGDQYDRVVCSGGDGTLNETISGLLELEPERRPVLGYVPAGTTNDFSKNLMLPRGMEGAARAAVAGIPRPCDIGRFNGRPFVYVAAFGAFTDVSYDTPQEFKSMFGHMAYLMEGVTRLTSLKSYVMRVEHDNGILEGEFLYGMTSNTVSVGGFQGIPTEEVKLDDGLFEVLLVRSPKTPAELQSILVTLAKQSPPEGGAVTLLQTSRLTVTSAEELPWTLDGEYGGSPKQAVIENCKHAMTIVWGK